VVSTQEDRSSQRRLPSPIMSAAGGQSRQYWAYTGQITTRNASTTTPVFHGAE